MIIILGLFLGVTSIGGLAESSEIEDGTKTAVAINKIYDMSRRVRNNYVDAVDMDRIMTGAMRGMLKSLDPHSEYYTKEEYEGFIGSARGEFEGIGITIQRSKAGVKVIAPIDGTPAKEAGIISGDLIIAVDDTYIQDKTITESSNMMRGKPGTMVKLKIARKGNDDFITLKIIRKKIKVPSVKSFYLTRDTKYIRIASFGTNTAKDFKEALKSNPKSIIIDLRNNPGGLLSAAIEILDDLILPYKKLLTIDGRDNNKEVVVSRVDPIFSGNLILLVNSGSASASEVIAGTIRDTKRGIIIGEKTFGKGSVQSMIPLPDGTAMKITIALYHTPSGKIIQANGIEPHILFNKKMVRKEKVSAFLESDYENYIVDKVGRLDSSSFETTNEAKEIIENDSQVEYSLDILKALEVR